MSYECGICEGSVYGGHAESCPHWRAVALCGCGSGLPVTCAGPSGEGCDECCGHAGDGEEACDYGDRLESEV